MIPEGRAPFLVFTSSVSYTIDCWLILQKLTLASVSILQMEENTEWEGGEREPFWPISLWCCCGLVAVVFFNKDPVGILGLMHLPPQTTKKIMSISQLKIEITKIHGFFVCIFSLFACETPWSRMTIKPSIPVKWLATSGLSSLSLCILAQCFPVLLPFLLSLKLQSAKYGSRVIWLNGLVAVERCSDRLFNELINKQWMGRCRKGRTLPSRLHLPLQQATFTQVVWLCLCPSNTTTEVGEARRQGAAAPEHTMEGAFCTGSSFFFD